MKENRFIRGALLAVALVLTTMAVASPASAQWTYNRGTSSEVTGTVVAVSNAIDSVIVDGTWVMIDTTTAATSNRKKFVVRPWNCSITSDHRFYGIAVGPIRKSSQGGTGQVLVQGWHYNAMFSGGLTIFANVGPAMDVWGGGGARADTLNISRGRGIFMGYVSATSTRGRVYLYGSGSVQ